MTRGRAAACMVLAVAIGPYSESVACSSSQRTADPRNVSPWARSVAEMICFCPLRSGCDIASEERVGPEFHYLRVGIERKQLLRMRDAAQRVASHRNEAALDVFHVGERRRHQNGLID